MEGGNGARARGWWSTEGERPKAMRGEVRGGVQMRLDSANGARLDTAEVAALLPSRRHSLLGESRRAGMPRHIPATRSLHPQLLAYARIHGDEFSLSPIFPINILNAHGTHARFAINFEWGDLLEVLVSSLDSSSQLVIHKEEERVAGSRQWARHWALGPRQRSRRRARRRRMWRRGEMAPGYALARRLDMAKSSEAFNAVTFHRSLDGATRHSSILDLGAGAVRLLAARLHDPEPAPCITARDAPRDTLQREPETRQQRGADIAHQTRLIPRNRNLRWHLYSRGNRPRYTRTPTAYRRAPCSPSAFSALPRLHTTLIDSGAVPAAITRAARPAAHHSRAARGVARPSPSHCIPSFRPSMLCRVATPCGSSPPPTRFDYDHATVPPRPNPHPHPSAPSHPHPPLHPMHYLLPPKRPSIRRRIESSPAQSTPQTQKEGISAKKTAQGGRGARDSKRKKKSRKSKRVEKKKNRMQRTAEEARTNTPLLKLKVGASLPDCLRTRQYGIPQGKIKGEERKVAEQAGGWPDAKDDANPTPGGGAARGVARQRIMPGPRARENRMEGEPLTSYSQTNRYLSPHFLVHLDHD
ncbi:hypothetical protein C8R45DRAFT_1138362 [Mycena sanguinolenta]|nr:hypothetical protein C8R45DRAFT_1138362 [Mycena sanguinolenta]